MYLSSLSLFRVCVKSILGFQFPCFYCVFFVLYFVFLGLGFLVCMHAHATCMRTQTRNERVCICIQLLCACMSYVCTCILKPRKSNSISVCFSFVLVASFSLYFNLASVSLSLFLSVLFQFCQVLKFRILYIQNSNLYCWQTMIKTMCLEVFKSSSKLCVYVKLEFS